MAAVDTDANHCAASPPMQNWDYLSLKPDERPPRIEASTVLDHSDAALGEVAIVALLFHFSNPAHQAVQLRVLFDDEPAAPGSLRVYNASLPSNDIEWPKTVQREADRLQRAFQFVAATDDVVHIITAQQPGWVVAQEGTLGTVRVALELYDTRDGMILQHIDCGRTEVVSDCKFSDPLHSHELTMCLDLKRKREQQDRTWCQQHFVSNACESEDSSLVGMFHASASPPSSVVLYSSEEELSDGGEIDDGFLLATPVLGRKSGNVFSPQPPPAPLYPRVAHRRNAREHKNAVIETSRGDLRKLHSVTPLPVAANAGPVAPMPSIAQVPAATQTAHPLGPGQSLSNPPPLSSTDVLPSFVTFGLWPEPWDGHNTLTFLVPVLLYNPLNWHVQMKLIWNGEHVERPNICVFGTLHESHPRYPEWRELVQLSGLTGEPQRTMRLLVFQRTDEHALQEKVDIGLEMVCEATRRVIAKRYCGECSWVVDGKRMISCLGITTDRLSSRIVLQISPACFFSRAHLALS